MTESGAERQLQVAGLAKDVSQREHQPRLGAASECGRPNQVGHVVAVTQNPVSIAVEGDEALDLTLQLVVTAAHHDGLEVVVHPQRLLHDRLRVGAAGRARPRSAGLADPAASRSAGELLPGRPHRPDRVGPVSQSSHDQTLGDADTPETAMPRTGAPSFASSPSRANLVL